ncbi:MAG: zinc ABC transporter substrate-binding protein [Thermoleophilia bacterium]
MRLRTLTALLAAALVILVSTSSCGNTSTPTGDASLTVVASLSFIADMAQNVAGDRVHVTSLVPLDTDPHAFEPSPSDLQEVAAADIVILNGGGLEGQLEKALQSAGGDATIVYASQGLASRTPQPGEPELDEDGVDPHFWLDPQLGIKYVENIAAALSAVDPEGADTYAANAQAYIKQLEAVDEEIRARVATIPEEQRKLIMNHASHGYYADAYGFTVVGTVIPSVSTGESPSAQQLTALTEAIKKNHVRAIFVELGEDPTLARQIAAETGIEVVDDLLDHSLTEPGGVAPTYIDLLRYDTERIVGALQ